MRKLSYKKSVELDLFGQFLVEKCVENKIDRVLDVGCGLGHLLGWIGEKLPNLELVGVDCNDSFCDKGTKIYGQVKFNVLEISLENCQDFLDLLQNTGKRTALISLHGCGDLQETLIKAFLKCNISKVPLLLTIGCCYHKTKKPDNWIISDFLKNQLGYVNINGSALRMGAEMRFNDYINMSEAERAKRLNSLMIRAVTEVFYQRNDINALIEHRSRRRNLGNTISEAAEAIASRYGVEDDVKELWLKEMLAIEQEFQGERDKIQLFLDIQYSLQHVMESLILLDRAQYVEENGGTAELIPLFPTDISPRNTCLTVKR
ncbi:unnamed protein product [Bursaphelenchus okinawaensis]|uniref:Methyltransferase domain-containing protein n=1 Tax=Bursaphelenchus okinawaensis TaxID=465554 RepID=A0A811KCZ5_9BILA|nr:unnamed protein product [Bursaphelenchus okinawaensis]CAG9101238.1 unnamed protein product [Bursaphelenchus okinawaensis]